MEQFITDQPKDGSQYMRPFAIGMTAYLVCYTLFYMVTHGEFHSPDPVADVYFFILAAYAGAPEIKRWTVGQTEDPEGWAERIRKGGPLVTLWFLLWAAAVLWRIHDPSIPMPPELKPILLQILGLFFGTYALRQMRKRSTRRRRVQADVEADSLSGGAQDLVEAPADMSTQIYDFLARHGPSTPKAIRQALGLSRSTLTRALNDLLEAHRIVREAASDRDPNPTYRPR